MTEAEWLAGTDPAVMARFLCDELRFSRKPIGRRKLRLYACACCRRAWHLWRDERRREAVEVAERYADGAVSKAELDRAGYRGEEGVLCDPVCDRIGVAVLQIPFQAASYLASAAWREPEDYRAAEAAERVVQADLLRDIFGNPFRPIRLDPAWQTQNAVILARTIYEERRFELLPLLADLLEEAGCPTEVSAHCRGPGPHARGCWVVDAILGRH